MYVLLQKEFDWDYTSIETISIKEDIEGTIKCPNCDNDDMAYDAPYWTCCHCGYSHPA